MYGTDGAGGEIREAELRTALNSSVTGATSPESFIDHMKAQSYRPETIRTYARHCREWQHCAKMRRVDILAPPLDEVGRYINVWHAKDQDGRRILKPSANLKRTRRQALALYGTYLRGIGLSQGYPTSLVRVERDKARSQAQGRTLTPEEIAAFLEAGRRRDPGTYMVARILCDVGARAHEMADARRRSWLGTNVPPLLRVGGEGRGSMADRECAPVTAEAMTDYRNWLDAALLKVDRRRDGPLLLLAVTRGSAPVALTERRLERLVSRLGAEAGIELEGLNPRAFRCSWIRQALASFPLAEVSAAVGHKNLTTTLRYCPSGSVPVFAESGRLREVVDGSVARGVVLMRAMSGGEPQPALQELMAQHEQRARLRTELTLLTQLEAGRVENEALRRQVDALRVGAVA